MKIQYASDIHLELSDNTRYSWAVQSFSIYENEKNGISVIAIGGDKLSRGLTLEGLSVSYFLRASKMYDTLMQMGRWFGYRPGYVDLCRLFMKDVIDGKKELTDRMKYTFYLNLQALKKRGFPD